MRSPFLDWLMPLFSDRGFLLIPLVLGVSLGFFWGRRSARVWLLALVLAAGLANFASEHIVKNLFAQERPYVALDNVHVYRNNAWLVYNPAWREFDNRHSTNSMPSTHAANVAAIVTVLALWRRRSLVVTAPVAGLVGLSRIYTGHHYPGDVLAGYLLGALVGAATVKATFWASEKVLGRFEEAAPLAQERKLVYGMLAAWAGVNFFFVCMTTYGLSGDEAQYWDWSRRLALGYYSKPPMVAYVIALLTHLGGHKEWVIRSGAVMFSTGSLALIHALALRIAKTERAALLAVGVALAMPATWVGSVVMTTDPIMIFFWVLAMYAFHRAIHEGAPAWWLVTGLPLGLGALAKYTVLVLAVSFVLYLLLADRRQLASIKALAAAGVMVLCLAGVVYWNATNGWVSLRHTASIGAGNSGSAASVLKHVGMFWGGQLGVVSPILFGLYVWAFVRLAARARHDRDALLLFLSGGLLFGFYVIVSFVRKPEANWPAAAYTAAAIALAWVWEERERTPGMRRLLTAGLALGLVMGIAPRTADLAYAASARWAGPGREDRLRIAGLSIDPDKDPTNELYGARELGAAISRQLDAEAGAPPFIFSDRYQTTALSAFYTRGRPRTFCMNPGGQRYNQYDLWGGWQDLVGRDGIFVTGGDAVRAAMYIEGMVAAGAFDWGELLETVRVYRGKTLVRTFTISRLYNYSGYVPQPGDERF